MRRRGWTRVAVAAALTALVAGVPGTALAHQERGADFPPGTGHVPAYRSYDAAGKHVVVCTDRTASLIAGYSGALKAQNDALLAKCGAHEIQAAVEQVKAKKASDGISPDPGWTIYVMPGVYTEPTAASTPLTTECQNVKADTTRESGIGTISDPTKQPAKTRDGTPVAISYADQVKCPHNLNLIAIFGDSTPDDMSHACNNSLCGLQLEGTGATPSDVLIDNRFSKLNGIRADRVDGVYFRNFLIQQAEFNSLYVMETDGYVVDRVIARANDEYGFLAFASDHGLFTDCEAYYNGDSGIYPGSAADVNKDNPSFEPVRYAVEVRRCSSHDNTLGLSGTGGNSIYIHDNAFFHNATGMSLDSFFPGHPGLPQDHTHITHNQIYANNSNYYAKYVKNGDDGVCNAKTPMPMRGYINGTVCPSVPVPVGTGVFIAGGNFNSIDHDQIYDNWRYGAMLLWVPAELRGAGPADTFDTSHRNHYVDNNLGTSPAGLKQPNGLEFWWDDEGHGNCWQDNISTYGVPTSNTVNPAGLPRCDSGGSADSPGVFAKDAPFVSCTQYDKNSQPNPPACEWFVSPKEPAGRQSGDVVPSGTGSGTTGTSAPPTTSAATNNNRTLASTGLGVGVGIAGLLLLLCAAFVWRAGRPGRAAR